MMDEARKVNPEISGRKPSDTAGLTQPLSVATPSALQADGLFNSELSREHAENF